MELTLEQYKKVQQYLDEAMTTEEEALFMEEVSVDSTLQEYLQFEIELRENLVALRNLKTDEPATPAFPSKKKQPGNVINIKALIAIAACALLVVSSIIWLSGERSKSSKVAKKNDVKIGTDSTPVQNLDTSQRNNQAEEKVNFAALFKQYYTKELPSEKPDALFLALRDYEKAEYKRIQDLDPSNLPADRSGGLPASKIQHIREIARFYQGISFIETNNHEKALKNFTWLVNHSKNEELKQKAIWYQALVELRIGNINQAISKLTSLSTSKSVYSSNAKSLLQALKH